jgi:hypothetical protein
MAACPKAISIDCIAQLNRDLLKATLAPPPKGKSWEGAA